jgi:hypothetical protein
VTHQSPPSETFPVTVAQEKFCKYLCSPSPCVTSDVAALPGEEQVEQLRGKEGKKSIELLDRAKLTRPHLPAFQLHPTQLALC